MAYVLTNGKYYIKMTDTGAVAKTDNINEARVYFTTEKAKERLQNAPGKTRGYYILDIGSQSKYYFSNGRIRFPKEIRELVYRSAEGRCALCGIKLSYENMTIDHITPLALGGSDTVENLQCACYACNQLKRNILQDDFINQIIRIFMFQVEKRCSKNVKLRIMRKLVEAL